MSGRMPRATPSRAGLRAALLLGGAASLAALVSAGTAPAQEIEQSRIEGKVLSATISQRFEANDNYNLDDPSPGTSYFADTRLNLGYLNATDTQTFRLGLDTGLRALWEAGEDFRFTVASPTSANLGYVNEWASGAFDAALTFRQRRIDYIESIDDFVTDNGALPDDLDQLAGNSYEQRYDANIGVAFATDSPSSYALRFLATQIDYTEDTPGQSARTTLEGQANWTLQLTPVFSSIVSGDYLAYDADNTAETSLRVSTLDAGLIYEPSANFLVGGGLGYADRQREDTNGAGVRSTTQSNNGPLVRANLRYNVEEDFVLRANAAYTTAAPDPQFTGNVVGTYRLPRGSIRGRIFQNYTATKSGGNQARVNGASIGIERELTTLASLSLDLAYAHQQNVDEVVDTGPADIDRVTAVAALSYDITEAVAVDVGYRFRSREQEPNSAQSNAVFFQIGRTFESLP